MTLSIETGIDLGDGELTITYDSDTSPLSISLRLCNEDNTVFIKRIDLQKYAYLVTTARRLLAFAMLEESPEIDEDEDEEGDDE